jgi:hypothetical protein
MTTRVQDSPTLADIRRDPHVLEGKSPADISGAIAEAKEPDGSKGRYEGDHAPDKGSSCGRRETET